MLDLEHYLKRINYQGSLDPNYQTLAGIHHAHLLHIPYENGDVQLGTPLDFDMARIFKKLITDQRGGWCYEMNGLLGWALGEIGFQVMRMSGAVMRATQGDAQLGNHLMLEVMLDQQPFLADVGLGDGMRFPIPIETQEVTQQGLTYRMEHLPDGYWRFHNHVYSNVSSFDFKHQPADESELSRKCGWLQQDPSSPFKQLLIVNRFRPTTIETLLGKIRTTIGEEGKTSHELDSFEAFRDELRETFGLTVDLSSIWPEVEAAHEAFFNKPPNPEDQK